MNLLSTTYQEATWVYIWLCLDDYLSIEGYVYVIDRTKLKQTEVDCEYLKRCCESLTEENRRLQKEVKELRALKTSSPFCMQLPATTLTMCPSCERVATSVSQPSTSAAHNIDLSKSSFHSPLIPVKPGTGKQVSWKHVRNKWLQFEQWLSGLNWVFNCVYIKIYFP